MEMQPEILKIPEIARRLNMHRTTLRNKFKANGHIYGVLPLPGSGPTQPEFSWQMIQKALGASENNTESRQVSEAV